MNLKDQVLSIEQVRELQELQELGFDINKHSSLKSNGKQIIVKDDFYIGGAPLFPTMTIGDIIEVLPEIIHKKYSLDIGKNYVDYCDDHFAINGYVEFKLIDALFEMLKWCIKEKHIEL